MAKYIRPSLWSRIQSNASSGPAVCQLLKSARRCEPDPLVESELLRPTFKLRDKPLAPVCGFLSFELLTEKLTGIRQLGLASSLKPDFLQKSAEYYGAADEE